MSSGNPLEGRREDCRERARLAKAKFPESGEEEGSRSERAISASRFGFKGEEERQVRACGDWGPTHMPGV